MFKKFILVLIIIGGLGFAGYYIYNNVSFVDDTQNLIDVKIDEPEINKDILGNLNIYLVNLATNEIQKETRNISIKQLNSSPYEVILNELKTPSTDSNMLIPIPENCRIINITNSKDILEITLSSEFINQEISNGKDKLILESIICTLNNLKEIDGIKISIENTENASLGNYTLNNTYSILDFK